jgi:S1-C subfamily serine protease
MEDKFFGKQVRCPRCQKVLQVPAPKPAPPLDVEPVDPVKAPQPREKQEAISSKPVRPIPAGATRSRADSADRVHSRPDREKTTPARNMTPLILAIVGGTLVLVVAGAGTFWFLRSEFLKPAKTADNTAVQPKGNDGRVDDDKAKDVAQIQPNENEENAGRPKSPQSMPKGSSRPSATPNIGDGKLPAETLAVLKAATVFVKVSIGKLEATGSGFLMKVDGNTGYVVTNDHVVAPPPGLRIKPRVNLVFWSGTKQEKIVPAEVLATDPSRDLAMLKTTGLSEFPAPLDMTQQAELSETMTVWILGFPFGDMLSTTRGNPAITIGKGTISSIRNDERDEAKVIQIDGDINPGNSGGPVVDGSGGLVGITVAKITGTHIGMAIPPAELTKMLNGRVGAVGFTPLSSDAGMSEIQVQANLIDPLNKITAVGILYVGADPKPKLQRNPDGTFLPLPGAQRVDLAVEAQKARGTIKVPASQGTKFAFQAFYVNGQGKTIYTGLGDFRTGSGKPNEMAKGNRQPPKGWTEYTPKNGAYTILLPPGGRRTESERSIHVQTARVKFNVVQVQQNRGPTFFLAEITLPLQLMRGSTPKQKIDAVRDAILKDMSGRIVEEKDAPAERGTGREYTVATGQGLARVRLIALGNRIYDIRVTGAKDDLAAEDAETFLDSFHLAALAPPKEAPPLKDAPAPTGKQPVTKETNDDLRGAEKSVGGISTVEAKLQVREAVPCMAWSEDGKSFYFLERNGILRQIALSDFKEMRNVDLGRKVSWLSRSALGLLVALPDQQEAWLLDPKTFEARSKMDAPSITHALSAPSLATGFAFNHQGDSVHVLDLKTGKTVRQLEGKDFASPVGLAKPAITPDGKYIFTTGGIEQVYRLRITGQELKFEEASQRIIQGRFEGLCVSGDGKYVCAPCGGGNYPGLKNHPQTGPYSTYIYPVGNLNKTAFLLNQGAFPLAVGFDAKAGLVYTQNIQNQLIVFNDKGMKLKEYRLDCGNPRQYLVHPDGRKVLILGEAKLLLATLAQK